MPSEVPESDPSESNPQPDSTPGLSRRDFLRRAGKEAAETGSRLVPGAAIARTVLGTGPSAGDKNGDDKTSRLPAWLRALVSRRTPPQSAPPPSDTREDSER